MVKTRRQLLGQHFLHDRNIARKIVRFVSPGKENLVVEIGPGRGALTFLLADQAGRVVALEKDGRLASGLRERAPANLEVIEIDVLLVSFRDLLAGYPEFSGRVILAGNLPYSISSPLLSKVLEDKGLFRRCVFLLQKEFAQRVCAGPGSKPFAPLSILTQNAFEARIVLAVSPSSFSPPPRVESALVRLERRERDAFVLDDEASFRGYLRSAFRQRRKTLFNNLLAGGFSRASVAGAFTGTGLEARLRAEALPAGKHIALFHALNSKKMKPTEQTGGEDT